MYQFRAFRNFENKVLKLIIEALKNLNAIVQIIQMKNCGFFCSDLEFDLKASESLINTVTNHMDNIHNGALFPVVSEVELN